MAKLLDQRVAVLVDLQNLYHGARLLHNRRVNFAAVMTDAVAGRKLIRAIGYGITTEEATEEKFFEFLTTTGFDVKTKELQIFSDGSKKGDWDVGIAIDAIKLSQSVDALILMTGDGDFIPLVEYIKNTSGCRVELVAFEGSTSTKLLTYVDEFLDIGSNPKKYLFKA